MVFKLFVPNCDNWILVFESFFVQRNGGTWLLHLCEFFFVLLSFFSLLNCIVWKSIGKKKRGNILIINVSYR